MAQGLDGLITTHHPLELAIGFADVMQQRSTSDSGIDHAIPRG